MRTFSEHRKLISGSVKATICLLMACAVWSFGVSAQTGYGNSISRLPKPPVWVAESDERDDRQENYRSKAEVLREVKKRYDARVLKISLNKQREVYRVRLLMPNGKIRNISVSARR